MKISLTTWSILVLLASWVMAESQPTKTSSIFENKSATRPSPVRLDALDVKRHKLRVASYNIERGIQFDKVQANLEEARADLILLQEVPGKMLRTLARKFGMNYQFGPYSPNGDMGIGILAKGKLAPDKLFSMKDERNFALSVKWSVQKETFFVVSVHLKSLQRPVTTGLLNAMKPHTVQVKRILKQVKKHQLPTIIGGDFNTLAWTPEYQSMAAEMKDVAVVAKSQNKPTIFIGVGGYRIDYFFVDDSWKVRDYAVGPKPGSDHRMIQAVLEWRGEKKLSDETLKKRSDETSER